MNSSAANPFAQKVAQKSFHSKIFSNQTQEKERQKMSLYSTVLLYPR